MGHGLVAPRWRVPALPVEGFVHPIALMAMVVLVVNDHLLKGAGWLPGWLTGKLSDFAGMIFFPLFLVALVNTFFFGMDRIAASFGRTLPMSCRLTRGKLLTSCLITGLVFGAIQIWPDATAFYTAVHHLVGVHARVTPDPSDLIALCCLPVSYLIGRHAASEISDGI